MFYHLNPLWELNKGKEVKAKEQNLIPNWNQQNFLRDKMRVFQHVELKHIPEIRKLAEISQTLPKPPCMQWWAEKITLKEVKPGKKRNFQTIFHLIGIRTLPKSLGKKVIVYADNEMLQKR